MIYRKVYEEMIAQQEKYFNLVWYARKSRLDLIEHQSIRNDCRKIEELYPEECKNLNGENSDWYHGFNSGMLAATRYFFDLRDFDKEEAQQNFPDLDT